MIFYRLIFTLCYLAVMATGIGALIYGVFRRRWGVGLFGACICLGLIVPAVTSVDIEMNPHIADDASVVGTWTDGHETIILRSDYSADFTTSDRDRRGCWRRYDWNLYLMVDDIDLVFRFVTVGDDLRLVTDLPFDHSSWDGDSGLRLKPSDTPPKS